ncbi:hypothetical protein DB347_24665 [Opitutaceae bacterium EW11]|nr:hypothetical protein DB347_24665 [Opitutaceae bacterium EW11]
MSPGLHFVVGLAAILGCGLIAGTFFAFSCFIMRALAKLPASQGIAAMQSINVVVLNPIFLGVFLGTGVLCAGLAVHAALSWSHAGAGWLLAGGLFYLAGDIVVTGACNVPRNDMLARLDPQSETAAALWGDYIGGWTAWNHVRTVTGLAAAGCLTIGLQLSHSGNLGL